MFVFWWMIKFKHSVEVFYPLLQTRERNRQAKKNYFLKEQLIFIWSCQKRRCVFSTPLFVLLLRLAFRWTLPHTHQLFSDICPKKKIMRRVFDERLLTTSSSAEFWSEKTSWTSLTDCQRLFGDSRCQKMSQLSERLCRVAVFGGCCLSEENKTAEVTASSLPSLNICNTTNHPVSPANI